MPDASAARTPPPSPWRSWSNLWQIPAIASSSVLIFMGIRAATGQSAAHDFEAALAMVEQLVERGEFKAAGAHIKQNLEPDLDEASSQQAARFHAAVADLVSMAQQAENISEPVNNKQVAAHYEKAAKLGADMKAEQLERWARAMIALSDFEGAQQRLGDLEAMLEAMEGSGAAADSEPAYEETQRAAVHAAKIRVVRALIQARLDHHQSSFDQVMAMLTEFRLDRTLSAADEMWVIARQAQLRLRAGFAHQAVESLLVDMRRLESRGEQVQSLSFGELYTLLAKGYCELGEYDRAQALLEEALKQFTSPQPVQGEAIVLMGQLALARGQLDLALDKFHLVVRDFLNTPSYVQGLLGRAEVHSILGEHQASLSDYTLLSAHLAKGAGGPAKPHEMTSIVAESLCDRHDAALAMGKLELALDYGQIAEGLFKPDQVPADVLLRLASANRQLADNLVADEATQTNAAHASERTPVHPAVRHQANAHYELAGDYYLRHSDAPSSSSGNRELWATSLWLAADSHDRAGRPDLAVAGFVKYLERRPMDDNRRGETLMRLAQAHHAQLDYDKAITYYREVVDQHDRSSFATEACVPLARCYLAVNRRPEAQQLLSQVLAGDRLLNPRADDYRDALIELGRLHYEDGKFAAAIERFSEAVARYPEEAGRAQTLYLLAESYRASAMDLIEQRRRDPTLSPSDVQRMTALESAHLQHAANLFAEISEAANDGQTEAVPNDDVVRRARLYRADCTFYLGRYHEAVALYDQVTRQYSTHSSSMYALIQIVNCYDALDDRGRAAAAHQRALARLRQLPESAFDAPDVLMDRLAWERWLESAPVDPTQMAAVSVPSG